MRTREKTEPERFMSYKKYNKINKNYARRDFQILHKVMNCFHCQGASSRHHKTYRRLQ